MSKYLRTKDNLYEVESSFVDYRGTRIYQTVKNVLIEETRVVAIGDKIEEVCDSYIVIDDKNLPYSPYPIPTKTADGKLYDIENFKLYHEIRLGIWTDQGLIYKAKLNKERKELELL